MIQPNLLELAKQGDAQAIASVINYLLQPKDITAKVVLKDGCLQVMLESFQVPEQESSGEHPVLEDLPFMGKCKGK